MAPLTSLAHILCYEKEVTTDNGKLEETEILIREQQHQPK